MSSRLLLPFALLFVLAACKGPDVHVAKPDLPCERLDTLLQHVEQARLALEEERPWDECAEKLSPVLSRLRDNMKADTGECNFLNMKKFPEIDRLMFVDLLRERTEQDTIEQGIYFLLHLRGIFIEDEDFSEFFAEELAHVAHHNPTCFQGYLKHNPDQEIMLLYSTEWNRLDIDTLIGSYAAIDSGGAVVEFLKEEKARMISGS